MEQNARLAERYSLALAELATERGELERVAEDMAAVARLCEESRDFRLLLRSPVIRGADKKRAVDALFSKHLSKTSRDFMDLLLDKGREIYTETIALRFGERMAELKDIQRAEVVTTVALNAAERKEVEARVRTISGRKNVELSERLDKDMLGGYILRVGDKQLDASIHTKLRGLRDRLSTN